MNGHSPYLLVLLAILVALLALAINRLLVERRDNRVRAGKERKKERPQPTGEGVPDPAAKSRTDVTAGSRL